MIPQAHITEWATTAPWATDADIEQDLILSRLMIEIANNDVLGEELAMRGGTCLHKLHLRKPLRYSEDLDYVRGTRSNVGRYIDALRDIGAGMGLSDCRRELTSHMVHVIFVTRSTDQLRRIRIKIEMNIREVEPCFERVTREYRVASSWWSGEALIKTFAMDELMGTKLRALYQRSKGRDLFDLWHALNEPGAHDERIIQAFNHYMGNSAFSYADFAANLSDKLTSPGFTGDLTDLVTTSPVKYEVSAAANLVMERLGSRLRSAPPLASISGGLWRQSSK